VSDALCLSSHALSFSLKKRVIAESVIAPVLSDGMTGGGGGGGTSPRPRTDGVPHICASRYARL
jgi:hypothetical protein